MSEGGSGWFGFPERAKPVIQAGVLIGLGLGGFFDGIVFHQILQWHHMLTSYPDPTIAGDLRLNVMADGVFHAVTYLITLAGIILLIRAWRNPTAPVSVRTFFGAAILGWGLFNFVEGLINHHLLGIHHVWPAGPGSVLLWDMAFLAWGLLFIIIGYALIRGIGTFAQSHDPDATRLDNDRGR